MHISKTGNKLVRKHNFSDGVTISKYNTAFSELRVIFMGLFLILIATMIQALF